MLYSQYMGGRCWGLLCVVEYVREKNCVISCTMHDLCHVFPCTIRPSHYAYTDICLVMVSEMISLDYCGHEAHFVDQLYK